MLCPVAKTATPEKNTNCPGPGAVLIQITSKTLKYKKSLFLD
jgi:hypothetical protein